MRIIDRIAALALICAAAAPAWSVNLTTGSYPPVRMPEVKADTQENMMRAPLNQEKKKGLKVFGATQMDFSMLRHFVNYYENQYDLDRLHWISSEGEEGIDVVPNLHMIMAGAYNADDETYYAYKVKYYTIGITHAYQWLKVDTKTGEYTVLTELPTDAHDNTFLYDMAYSVYDGEMYGLVQNSDGTVGSRIGIMDLSDSSLSDLVQLDDYYYSISFDYEGTLYGVRWKYDGDGNITGTMLDKFDSDFNVASSRELLVDGKAYLAYFQQGLDFNYTTGDLIWAATDYQGNQKMIRINPDDASTTNLGGVGYADVMTALYVPFLTADDRQAPSQVKDLIFRKDSNGANSVTIEWTNPSTQWNRQPLEELSGVKIYRDNMDGEPVGTVNATIGRGGSYVDNGATTGVHTYYVVPFNSKGNGVPDSTEAYVGRDVPGPVNNLVVSTIDDGRGVNVSWTAPTTGDSEGWFDTDITYSITRMPGNKVVATDISGLSFDDKNIEEAQYYTYVVTPKSIDGVGTPLESEGILAGASLKVPFSTTFDSQNEANRFSSFDSNGYPGGFVYSANNMDPGTMSMCYWYNNTNDVILASPPMNLAKGKTYRVDWKYSLGRYGMSFAQYYNDFEVLGGVRPNAESMTTVLESFKDRLTEKQYDRQETSTYFVSPVDGDYCVGFHVATKSKNEDAWIYVTGFSISEVPEADLAVVDFKTPKYVSSDNDNEFRVEVFNNGLEAQDNYKVQVGVHRLDGVFVPLAETADVPRLENRESAVVRLSGKAAFADVQDLQARVELEGDGNVSNNASDDVEVFFEAGDAFNNVADIIPGSKASLWRETSLPIALFSSYSGSQTIYTREMLGLGTEEVEIVGLAWEYSSSHSVTDLNLRVMLGDTDMDAYRFNPEIISYADYEVFSDNVPLVPTEGDWMKIRFPEKVYSLPEGANLVVTVASEEMAMNGNYDTPVLFNVFNSSSAGYQSSDECNHSVSNNGNSAFTFDSKIYGRYELPVLHVAVKKPDSVKDVFGSDGMIGLAVAGRMVRLSGDVRTVGVYNMQGQCMQMLDASGRNTISLSVPAGIYILKAEGADGTARVIKAAVR